MTAKLPDSAVTVWARIVRAQARILHQTERALKQQGLPPLGWYDVLLELKRAPGHRLRPGDLQQNLLLAQHNVSRLLDRMEAKQLVKRLPMESDGRAQLVELTTRGAAMQVKMWPVYRDALRRHVAARLEGHELETLADLLKKLLPP